MKYSVIIPVYNAEKTISRCLDSLLHQEYHDAEIILVNDGSTDCSHEICLEYANSNPEIIYICKENGGVSSARNCGLDAASGDYILFVDSDDYVSSHYFTELDAIEPQLDYVIFSWYFDCKDKLNPHIYEDSEVSCDEAFFEQIFAHICRKRTISPWNKRFKRSIIENNQLRFHIQLSIGEDCLFNFCYILHCSSFRMMSNALYFVNVENENSLSRRTRSDLSEQLSIGYQQMRNAIYASDLLPNHKAKMEKAINYLIMCDIYSDVKRMHMNNVSCLSRHKLIIQKCKAFRFHISELPDTLRCRILWLMIKLRLSVFIDIVGWMLSHK